MTDDDFLLSESPKEKLNSTLESIAVSPVNIHGAAQHNCTSNAKGKLKKILNVFKEKISDVYNVLDTTNQYLTEIPRTKLRSLTDCVLP